MRYFRRTIKGREIHIYPLVCWHIGSKQSSSKFIAKMVRTIAEDDLAYWVYMGDAGECVTKTSKGNIYEQLVSPGDQLRLAAEILSPIRAKGLFGIRGNHGNRVDRDTGLGWDETFCSRVGIPYLGVSAFAEFNLNWGKSRSLSFSVYTHHGSSGSVTPAGKMSAGHKPHAFILADIILTAHSHACGECWPHRHYAYTDGRSRRIRWGTSRAFVCGSAYDSRSGYAEEKQYMPLLPEHLMIAVRGVERLQEGRGVLLPEITMTKFEAFSSEYTSEENKHKWAEHDLDHLHVPVYGSPERFIHPGVQGKKLGVRKVSRAGRRGK